MKVNGIDARKYNAKQLTVEVLPPSMSNDYEIITGAVLPIEFDTDMEMGTLKITMYFRGKDRNNLIRNMSMFMQNFTKSCDLELDGYRGKFRAYITKDSYTKMKVKNRYQLDMEFSGYFYDDEIALIYDGKTETTVTKVGSRKSPVTVEIYAKSALNNYTIKGFAEDITVKELAAGKTVIINGEDGTVSMDGANAIERVDLWEFPRMEAEETKLTFTNANAKVTIRYRPMWI